MVAWIWTAASLRPMRGQCHATLTPGSFQSASVRSLHKSELARFVPFIPTRHHEGLRRMPFPLTRVSRPSWRPSYVIQNTSNECSSLANGLSGACTQSAGLDTWQILASFQPGKLYIREFCGTSCECCEGAMHNLIELQETYKNNGVGAVAVVAEESAAFVGEALDFGTRGGPVPEVEPAGRARRHRHNEHGLMEASFSVEIPKALVVDRDGYIASIGHPNDLHGVLCLMAPGAPALRRKPPKGSGSPKMNQKRPRKHRRSRSRQIWPQRRR